MFTRISTSRRFNSNPAKKPCFESSSRPPYVPVAPTTSLDLFRAGSAPYLRGDYRAAIPHYEKVFELEGTNPALEKSLWRVLVDNLGMVYGMTGDLRKATATF